MQQQTAAQTLLERGATLLKGGRLSEAATAFTQASAIEPESAGAHLGVAEANLALGELGTVAAACRQVLQLAPESADGGIARALLAVVAGRYDAALAAVEQSIVLDPGRPYAHALRGYCLRQLGQRYEGALADARAARGWGDRDFDHLFPKAAPAPTAAAAAAPAAAPQRPDIAPGLPQRIAYAPQRPWQERSGLERRLLRLRLLTRNIPAVTLTLMVVNIAVYLIGGVLSGNLFSPFRGVFVNSATGVLVGAPNPLYGFGVEQGLLIKHDPVQVYRLLTAMFLHEGIEHIALNMLSLYFVGVITERIFGAWRFALIYFASGIIAGAAQAFFAPGAVALGASGAIFGIFGAFGAFALLRRRAFGGAANAVIGQWVVWLGINLVFTFSVANIGVADHIAGVISGLALGALLVVTTRPRRAPG